MQDLRAVAWLRWGRAGVTTAVAGALGLWAHVLAGGLLPRPGWLIAALGVLWVANAVVLGVPAGRLRLMALIAGGQFAFHVYLTAAAGHGDTHVNRAIGPVATSAANTTVLTERRGSLFDLTIGQSSYAAPSGTPHWITHVVDDLSGPHALMAVAHLVAAAAVGCWLAVGEQALWVLLALLGAAMLVLATRAMSSVTAAATRPAIAAETRAVRSSWLSPRERPCTVPLVRRGPPLSVAA